MCTLHVPQQCSHMHVPICGVTASNLNASPGFVPLWVHETFSSSGVNLLPRARRAGEVASLQPFLPPAAHEQLCHHHATRNNPAGGTILHPASFTCWHSLMERSTVAANPPVPSPQPQPSMLCFTPGSSRYHLHPATLHGPHHFLSSIQPPCVIPTPTLHPRSCAGRHGMAVGISHALSTVWHWHSSPCFAMAVATMRAHQEDIPREGEQRGVGSTAPDR